MDVIRKHSTNSIQTDKDLGLDYEVTFVIKMTLIIVSSRNFVWDVRLLFFWSIDTLYIIQNIGKD